MFSHINSVVKDSNGDYIISARFASCIYKISGKDGSILWRLGGRNSSFDLQTFHFSYQHDARILEENSTTTVLSFLDNASNGNSNSSTSSSGLVVSLNTVEMTATLLHRYSRPDGHLSDLRGNVQTLENGNTFICWSANGYFSEFLPNGDLALDARFATPRFTTYRAFKFNFTATPTEPPVIKAFAYGEDVKTSVLVIYASWNGATEVDSWKYYGANSRETKYKLLGSVQRSGFETTLMVSGYAGLAYAEAVAANGTVLGRSSVERVTVPAAWKMPRVWTSHPLPQPVTSSNGDTKSDAGRVETGRSNFTRTSLEPLWLEVRNKVSPPIMWLILGPAMAISSAYAFYSLLRVRLRRNHIAHAFGR